MIVINILLSCVWLIIVPLAMGYVISGATRIQMNNKIAIVLFAYAIGNVAMWAVFQLLAVPMILLKQKLGLLIVMWCISLVVVFILLFLYCKKQKIKPICYKSKKEVRKSDRIWIIVLATIALIIIGYQCYKYIFFMHLDEDDSRFIVCAVDACIDGTMYLINPATGDYIGHWAGELVKDISSPWAMYLATMSKVLFIHPTIFAHTVYPSFLLVIGYIAFFLMGQVVFKGNIKKSICFVILASILHMYMAGTIYTQSRFTLVRIWQGKATVAGVMIPLVLALLMQTYEECNNGRIYVILFLCGLSMCLMSGMGIFFSGIMVGFYGIWYGLINKKFRNIIYSLIACLPTIVYGITYILIK